MAIQDMGIVSEVSGPNVYSSCNISIEDGDMKSNKDFLKIFGKDSHLFSLCRLFSDARVTGYLEENNVVMDEKGSERLSIMPASKSLNYIVAHRAKVVNENRIASVLENMAQRFTSGLYLRGLNVFSYEANFKDSNNYFKLDF